MRTFDRDSCALSRKSLDWPHVGGSYHIRLRMDEARRLLRETKRSVVEIALDAGCANPSHFAQLFRRETEPFALLIARLTYDGKGSPELACRFERFGTLGIALRPKRKTVECETRLAPAPIVNN